MSTPSLLTPTQAAPSIAGLFGSDGTCCLSVSEERAFGGEWLPLGRIRLAHTGTDRSPPTVSKLLQRGAYEWEVPCHDASVATASSLLAAHPQDRRRVGRALDEVASIAVRVGLLHPRFDSMAIEQMPFRRSTTVVADTSGILQGALDFVARFLHPAARVKVPAIAQMEVANLADRFLQIRRADGDKRRIRELMEHLTSQGGQRALLRLELQADAEVERTYLLGDPLRSAFERDSSSDVQGLNISAPIRSYADRLILEAARHHQAQSGPAHVVRLLTGDQGLARMALSEGVRPLYFTTTTAGGVFGETLSGLTFHPFSGHCHYVSLTALVWELATGFGTARLSNSDGAAFQVSAIGEGLSWAPYHADQDLLWCTQILPLSKPPPAGNGAKQVHAPEHHPGSGGGPSTQSVGSTPSTSFLRFNVQRMFRVVCAIDDNQEMTTQQAEDVIQAKSAEYRRFLQSGRIADVTRGTWVANDRTRHLSAALRNERVDEVRDLLLCTPSFAAFVEHLGELSVGQTLDPEPVGRGLTTYATMGEIAMVCASVSGSGIFPTPECPEPEAFADIALRRFLALDTQSLGLVATGEWLESLVMDEGIHPEVARRLLDQASETGLIRRSTEGSTPQLRFNDRIVHVLRSDSGTPIVERAFLYRGDYLIPGKASVSLRIEAAS